MVENEDIAMNIDSRPEEEVCQAKVFVEIYLKGASSAAEKIEYHVRLSQTIQQTKKAIADKFKIDIKSVCLQKGNEYLESDKTLQSYNIQDESILTMYNYAFCEESETKNHQRSIDSWSKTEH